MSSTTNPNRKPADRQLRAYEQASEYLVFAGENDGEFYVLGAKGSTYTATADTCTCPDFQRRRVACKHVHLVRFHLEADAPKPQIQAPSAAELAQAARRAKGEQDRRDLFG